MPETREYLEPGLEFGFQMIHSEFGAEVSDCERNPHIPETGERMCGY